MAEQARDAYRAQAAFDRWIELDTDEIAQLIMAVAAINSWNRIAIASGMVFEPPEER